jgi:hypothetical protein
MPFLSTASDLQIQENQGPSGAMRGITAEYRILVTTQGKLIYIDATAFQRRIRFDLNKEYHRQEGFNSKVSFRTYSS